MSEESKSIDDEWVLGNSEDFTRCHFIRTDYAFCEIVSDDNKDDGETKDD